MNWIKTYKFQLLFIIATLGLLTTYTLYMKRDIEINQLRKDNETLREYVVTLHERIELLDSYPYEHSKIENNDGNSDSPKHNDIGDCTKHRQCSCTCGDGQGTTKATTKKSIDLWDSRGLSF